MLYYTDKARKSAITEIEKEIVRIYEIPGNILSYTEAHSIINHLSVLKEAIEKEICNRD